MTFHINQPELVSAIILEIDRQAKERGIPSLPAEPYQFNAVCQAAITIKEQFAREKIVATPGMGILRWLSSDDTGASSMAMAHHLCNAKLREEDRTRHPLDPDDFGRCHRFLEAVPAARDRLLKMAAVSIVWARLIGAWDELTKLYIEELPTGSATKLFARMKELEC